mgnify:CR=1 FL=1
MKGSLIVILFFCVGCVMGAFNKFQFDTHTVSMYILYALMLQVGISIGSNKNLKAIVSHLHPKMLLIPLGTICFSKPAIAPVERVRLYGSGKRIRILFALFYPYHPVQRAFYRAATGYGIRNYRTVD